MKPIKYTPKTFLRRSAIVVLTLASFNSFGQGGIIWSSVQNFDDVRTYEYGEKLYSTNPQVQELINDYSITKIERALPASRKSELQNVVEIKCNCNETDLLVAVSRLTNIFTQSEIGPKYETLFVPDDYSIAFADDYALDLIGAQQAWDVTHGDSSVIIAISDQNFYVDHEEIVGKVHYYDTTNTSPQYHGTAVAVTAAGNTNNGMGKSSIGYDSELALYRMSYNDLLLATYSGYRVINVSWASGCVVNTFVQGVVDEVYENGSIIVAAAGNGATCGGAWNLVYPAACDHVISVTGIGSDDNHEATAGDSLTTFQHNADVDISAPGINVPLTVGLGTYLTSSGTSFSAPLVSGTIALMLAVDTCLTFEDIETILYSTAENIDALNPQYAGLIGNGRLNAGAAVEMASTYMSCGSDIGSNGLHNIGESESTAGLNDLENDGQVEINLFPNPSSVGTSITINSSDKIENCEITNVNGELIEILTPNADKVIVNGLSQGVYFAKISTEGGVTKTKRIVVV